MTALDLYKWINTWEPEWRWDINPDTKLNDVIMWLSIYSLDSFIKMLSPTLFDEGGISVRLTGKYIALWASSICDHYAINMEEVFQKENED